MRKQYRLRGWGTRPGHTLGQLHSAGLPRFELIKESGCVREECVNCLQSVLYVV